MTSGVTTSGVTTSGLFHRFCFSDQLQNHSEAGQSPMYSIAFYQKFVAVLELEMEYASRSLNHSAHNYYGLCNHALRLVKG